MLTKERLTILRHQIVNQKIKLLFVSLLFTHTKMSRSFLTIKWILVNWKTAKLASMGRTFTANQRTLRCCVVTRSRSDVNNVAEWTAALFCLLSAVRSKFCLRKRPEEDV